MISEEVAEMLIMVRLLYEMNSDGTSLILIYSVFVGATDKEGMVDTDRLLEELTVQGSPDETNADLAPILALMENVVEHGEVHAEFSDDSDRYVEIRKGTTTFDFEGGVFVIDDGTTEHRFSMRGLSNWHKPRNVFEHPSR